MYEHSSLEGKVHYYIIIILLVLGIDIKLHPAALPLLSPLGRSLSLQAQLGPIEILVEISMKGGGLELFSLIPLTHRNSPANA